jgi:hypothetical protein
MHELQHSFANANQGAIEGLGCMVASAACRLACATASARRSAIAQAGLQDRAESKRFTIKLVGASRMHGLHSSICSATQ